MNRRITCSQEEVVYQNRYVKVCDDHVTADDPRVTRYLRIIEGRGTPGVAVLPICRDQLGLVRVFRYPIDREMWEIPRGFGESETPEEDARRELEEETGIVPSKLIDLGWLHPNSGLLATTAKLFAAVCPDAALSAQGGDLEVIEFEWFSRDEVEQMIRDSTITDGFTLAAVLRAKLLNIGAL